MKLRASNSKKEIMKRIFFAISVLMIATLACQMTGLTPLAQPTLAPQPQNSSPLSPNSTVPQDGSLEKLYQQAIPGVVSIQVTTPQGDALGSGFVYDKQGHVITNFHVVDGATTTEVDFSSGFRARGTVVGVDKDSDIAVIKVDAPDTELHPLALGNSSDLQVGQTVIAIGNPFGLNGTMTVGIVSALGRTESSQHSVDGGGFFSMADIIQTDAAVNPGNSGGPLLNTNGEVVGINRAIITNSSNASGQPTNSGIAFAVSVNIVKRVLPSLISTGSYAYPYMGISFFPDQLMSLDVIDALGLKTFTGAYVVDVTKGSPADKAGIRAGTKPTRIDALLAGGDLVTAIDGKTIRTFDELIGYLVSNKSPGDTVVLSVIRDGQSQDITLTLDARPK
jgi:S1-C subfamily serine protease